MHKANRGQLLREGVVLAILLFGVVFTPVMGMPSVDLTWRTSDALYEQPPVAWFDYSPYDPSPFVTIQFYNYSYDPDGVSIGTCTWDFGDGTVIDSCDYYVNHRYADNGDYTVQLTVTTWDGRTASAARTVSVRTPDPVAQFGFNPPDPNPFDAVYFYNYSFDPAYAGIATCAWNLGDGTVIDSCDYYVYHQYAGDGDYLVTLTVTTVDGRTASTMQTVMVRTHDVAIVTFKAPQAAKSGQTRDLSVGIRNTRYPERVRIELLKSVPGGFDLVGWQYQDIPVRSGNRTTNVSFSYTFTAADAAVGKVTFKVTAWIESARDAFPADNEAIADPTKVSR
jgi:PKD repeat protein